MQLSVLLNRHSACSHPLPQPAGKGQKTEANPLPPFPYSDPEASRLHYPRAPLPKAGQTTQGQALDHTVLPISPVLLAKACLQKARIRSHSRKGAVPASIRAALHAPDSGTYLGSHALPCADSPFRRHPRTKASSKRRRD